jgi:hypothetical protein
MVRPATVVPESATVGKTGRKVCGARRKNNNGRCQVTAISPINGRCKVHGGAIRRGLANPKTTSGRYSLDLPTRVAARYESALSDPNLLSVRDDIALLQAAIADVMAEIKVAESRPDFDAILETVETMATNWQSWDWTRMNAELGKLKGLIENKQSQRGAMREIRELIKEKANLVSQENRMLLDREQMISVEQFLMAMRAMGSAVRRLVDDPKVLRSIDVEFRRLATVPAPKKYGDSDDEAS